MIILSDSCNNFHVILTDILAIANQVDEIACIYNKVNEVLDMANEALYHFVSEYYIHR